VDRAVVPCGAHMAAREGLGPPPRTQTERADRLPTAAHPPTHRCTARTNPHVARMLVARKQM